MRVEVGDLVRLKDDSLVIVTDAAEDEKENILVGNVVLSVRRDMLAGAVQGPTHPDTVGGSIVTDMSEVVSLIA